MKGTSRDKLLNEILDIKAIAILRLKETHLIEDIISAIFQGGIRCLEITSNTPDFAIHIQNARKKYTNVIIGAGTITNSVLAEIAIKAGAQFLVTPNTETTVIQTAHKHNVPIIVGSLTPTEVIKAKNEGADAIKLFPADVMGTNYLKSLLGPIDDVPILAVGGINAKSILSWHAAGAEGFGIGSWLFDKLAIKKGNFDQIRANAESVVKSISELDK